MSRKPYGEESKRAWMRRLGFKTEADVIAHMEQVARELGLDQEGGVLPDEIFDQLPQVDLWPETSGQKTQKNRAE